MTETIDDDAIEYFPIFNNGITITPSTVFQQYTRPNSHKKYSKRSSQSPLNKLTIEIVQCFQKCNPKFKISPGLKRILSKPSEGVSNDGKDNADSNLIIAVHDVLGDRYLVVDSLGQGTFGHVVKCKDLKDGGAMVAVKVIKNTPAYFRQAQIEIKILRTLTNSFDAEDKHHIVRLLDNFMHCNHLCLVFELLNINLFELIKSNKFAGLSTNVIRIFVMQLLDALSVISNAGIIHCDMKPENILLADNISPTIKLIDFGSACPEFQTMYSYIQSRFYRSPEVLFGLQYDTAIDMWSLGCICAELFLGLPLFPGASEYNQVARIVEMLGIPPLKLLSGKTAGKFFKRVQTDGGEPKIELKSEEEFCKDNNCQPQPWKRYFNYVTLEELIKYYPLKKDLQEKEIEEEKAARLAFTDFLKGLLRYDPDERWTAQQAIKHPFVTGAPFTGPYQPEPDHSRLHRRQQMLASMQMSAGPGYNPYYPYNPYNTAYTTTGIPPSTLKQMQLSQAHFTPPTMSYANQAAYTQLGTSPEVSYFGSIPINNPAASTSTASTPSSYGSISMDEKSQHFHGQHMALYSPRFSGGYSSSPYVPTPFPMNANANANANSLLGSTPTSYFGGSPAVGISPSNSAQAHSRFVSRVTGFSDKQRTRSNTWHGNMQQQQQYPAEYSDEYGNQGYTQQQPFASPRQYSSGVRPPMYPLHQHTTPPKQAWDVGNTPNNSNISPRQQVQQQTLARMHQLANSQQSHDNVSTGHSPRSNNRYAAENNKSGRGRGQQGRRNSQVSLSPTEDGDNWNPFYDTEELTNSDPLTRIKNKNQNQNQNQKSRRQHNQHDARQQNKTTPKNSPRAHYNNGGVLQREVHSGRQAHSADFDASATPNKADKGMTKAMLQLNLSENNRKSTNDYQQQQQRPRFRSKHTIRSRSFDVIEHDDDDDDNNNDSDNKIDTEGLSVESPTSERVSNGDDDSELFPATTDIDVVNQRQHKPVDNTVGVGSLRAVKDDPATLQIELGASSDDDSESIDPLQTSDSHTTNYSVITTNRDNGSFKALRGSSFDLEPESTTGVPAAYGANQNNVNSVAADVLLGSSPQGPSNMTQLMSADGNNNRGRRGSNQRPNNFDNRRRGQTHSFSESFRPDNRFTEQQRRKQSMSMGEFTLSSQQDPLNPQSSNSNQRNRSNSQQQQQHTNSGRPGTELPLRFNNNSNKQRRNSGASLHQQRLKQMRSPRVSNANASDNLYPQQHISPRLNYIPTLSTSPTNSSSGNSGGSNPSSPNYQPYSYTQNQFTPRGSAVPSSPSHQYVMNDGSGGYGGGMVYGMSPVAAEHYNHPYPYPHYPPQQHFSYGSSYHNPAYYQQQQQQQHQQQHQQQPTPPNSNNRTNFPFHAAPRSRSQSMSTNVYSFPNHYQS